MGKKVRKIYIDNGEVNFNEHGELASIYDIEDWTAMTGDVIDGIFECEDGIYQYINMCDIEEDEFAFVGYVRLNVSIDEKVNCENVIMFNDLKGILG